MPNVCDIHQNDEQKNMLENSFVDDELRELTKQLKEISKKTDEEKEKSEKLKEKEGSNKLDTQKFFIKIAISIIFIYIIKTYQIK